ncbi:hypothetical protein FHX42_005320 [Saccharopolyspora lacisalsi]|uniref:Uncharacterized protein n=2 Tax=Halosaccharopolyspora lacisalsi TaxID=1000566 RepID=A0A839E3Q0_9PSEU|nr:hypothetical protein [Halosaccharopolyspora lacisalsi]MBA8827913.1 hypothetical protein [Halosaccharopolyspora lacisalsi]
MADRCGCAGSMTIEVRGDHGITVTREGAPDLTYAISVDGSELVGDGMRWDPVARRFTTKLAPNGGLAYNATGALYVTGDGGGGGGGNQPQPATVAALEQRAGAQNVVAGHDGAGYMIKPNSTRGSVDYGARRGVDAMHLPVLFLRDGTPVVSSVNTVFGEPVYEQDHERWRVLEQLPGIWPSDPRGDTDPVEGWFGFLEPNEYGWITLAETFERVDRRTVLILDLRFPAIEGGGWARPTPDRQITAFLDDMIRLIRRYAAHQSVMVVSLTPNVPMESSTDTRDVLRPFYDASVPAVGPVIGTEQQATDIPPTDERWSWWRWCLLDKNLPIDTMTGYTSLSDVFALTYSVARHHEHQDVTVPSGAAGAIAVDPDYYAGAIDTHPRQGNFRYRKDSPTWWYSTVCNGLFGPQTATTDVSARLRGFMPARAPADALYMLGGQAVQPNTRTHFVLQGYLCPLPNPTNYQMSWDMDLEPPAGVDPNVSTLRAEVLFARDTDDAFVRWEDSGDKSGYIVSFATWDSDASKWAYVYAWDPSLNSGAGGTVERHRWELSTVDSGFVGFRVRVNADRVEFAITGRSDPNNVIAPVYTESASGEGTLPASRGPYLYFGRQAPPGDEPVRAVWHGWVYSPGQGDDPPAV